MTPEQALQILKQALVTKNGLTLDDMALVIQAWNVVAEACQPKAPQIAPDKKETK